MFSLGLVLLFQNMFKLYERIKMFNSIGVKKTQPSPSPLPWRLVQSGLHWRRLFIVAVCILDSRWNYSESNQTASHQLLWNRKRESFQSQGRSSQEVHGDLRPCLQNWRSFSDDSRSQQEHVQLTQPNLLWWTWATGNLHRNIAGPTSGRFHVRTDWESASVSPNSAQSSSSLVTTKIVIRCGERDLQPPSRQPTGFSH